MNIKDKPIFIKELIEAGKLQNSLNYRPEEDFTIGKKKVGEDLIIIGGPCSVEGEEMIIDAALQIKKAGGDALRAGAYKPCTYPVNKEVNGWKEGMQEKGLEFLIEAKKQSGLEIVSEIMEPKQLEKAYEAIDIIQVGTRNFQNYSLLNELSKQNKPVILKRGTWATIEEILGAVERLLANNLNKVIVCLRGVIGAPPYRHIYKSTRWQPDLMMIQALKDINENIPVIYDPSHATGKRSFVKGIALASLVTGADGLIVEAHPDPINSISDPDQAISFFEFGEIVKLSGDAASLYQTN